MAAIPTPTAEVVDKSFDTSPMENKIAEILGIKTRALEVGYSMAQAVVPHLVGPTISAEAAAEITSLFARKVARDYQADVQNAVTTFRKKENV